MEKDKKGAAMLWLCVPVAAAMFCAGYFGPTLLAPQSAPQPTVSSEVLLRARDGALEYNNGRGWRFLSGLDTLCAKDPFLPAREQYIAAIEEGQNGGAGASEATPSRGGGKAHSKREESAPRGEAESVPTIVSSVSGGDGGSSGGSSGGGSSGGGSSGGSSGGGSSGGPSNRSNKVNASAVPPAKPARIFS